MNEDITNIERIRILLRSCWAKASPIINELYFWITTLLYLVGIICAVICGIVAMVIQLYLVGIMIYIYPLPMLIGVILVYIVAIHPLYFR